MKNNGFTIVEIVIVVVVIGILGTITWRQFEIAKAKARDVARKADLHEISKAIRLYYADYGHLPSKENEGDPDINTLGGKPFHDARGYEYMKEIPQEKVFKDKPYCYQPNEDGKSFNLFVELEYKGDLDCKEGQYTCEGRSYCYTDIIDAVISKS